MNLAKYALRKVVKDYAAICATTLLSLFVVVLSYVALLILYQRGTGESSIVNSLLKLVTLCTYIISIAYSFVGSSILTTMYFIVYTEYKQLITVAALNTLFSYAKSYEVVEGEEGREVLIRLWEFQEQLRDIVFAYNVPLKKITKFLKSKGITYEYEIDASEPYPYVKIK